MNDQRREQIGRQWYEDDAEYIERMRAERGEYLKRQWHELNGRLDELRSIKVQPGAAVDFTVRESIIEAELDEIEYELGIEYVERMRAERDNKTEGSSDNGRA